MKKLLASVLAATVVASSFSACGSKDASSASGGGTDGGSEAISMVAILNNNIPIDNTDTYLWSLQDGKYQFEVTSFDRSVLNEKVNLMLSTNRYPEVFIKCTPVLTPTAVDDYGKKGVFIPLNDLIEEHAPNLSKLLDERPVLRDAITSDDGNIYSLPSIVDETSTTYAQWINQKWLDNLGLAMPTDMQSFYEVMTAFKEQDANGNGDPNDEIPVMMAIDPAQLAANWTSMLGQKWDKSSNTIEVDGQLQDVRTCETYKEALSWIAKFYQEGLLDKNIFTQEVSQAQAVGKAADVTGLTGGASPLTYCGAEYSLNFAPLSPFSDDVSYLNPGATVGALVITDICQDPAKVIEWADQFYGEEGSYRAWMGEEGKNFKWVDDTKTTYEWILPDGISVGEMREQTCLQGVGYIPALCPSSYNEGNPDPVSQIAYKGSVIMTESSSEYFPMLTYPSDDLKTVSSVEADVSSYANTYAAKICTGELDLESSWEDYLNQLENMRLSKMIEIKQAAYDRMK